MSFAEEYPCGTREQSSPRQGSNPVEMGNKYLPAHASSTILLLQKCINFLLLKYSRNPSRNTILILVAIRFFATTTKQGSPVGFWFASGNTTGVSDKGLRCCVYEKKRLSGLFPFRGRLSGDRFARSLALRARQPPDYPLASVLAHGSTPRSRPSGGLTQGMPPPNSFPLTLSSPGAFIVVLPHLLYVVFLWNAICGVSRSAGRYPYPPGEREGLIVGRRLQLSHGVAGKIC